MGNKTSKSKKENDFSTYHTQWCFGPDHQQQLKKCLLTHQLNVITTTIEEYIGVHQNTNNYISYIHCKDTPLHKDYATVPNNWLKYMHLQRPAKKSYLYDTNKDAIRVVILGAESVGKSALTLRFITNKYYTDHDPTIEDSYTTKFIVNSSKDEYDEWYSLKTENNFWSRDDIFHQQVKIDILDTCGEELSGCIPIGGHLHEPATIGQIFLLVFNVMDEQSYNAIVEIYEKVLKIRQDHITSALFMAVGNKCDLRDDPNYNMITTQVDIDVVMTWCRECRIPYIETSVKDFKNICFAFRHCIYEYWILTKHEKIK
eukprot:10662_1